MNMKRPCFRQYVHTVRSILRQSSAIVPFLVLTVSISFASTGYSEPLMLRIELETRLDVGGDLTGRMTIFVTDLNGASEDDFSDEFFAGLSAVEKSICLSRWISRISPSIYITKKNKMAPAGICSIQFRAERYAAVNDSTIDFRLPSALLLGAGADGRGNSSGCPLSTLLIPGAPELRIEVNEELKLPRRYQIGSAWIACDTSLARCEYRTTVAKRTRLLRIRHQIVPSEPTALLPSMSAPFSAASSHAGETELMVLLRQRSMFRILGVR